MTKRTISTLFLLATLGACGTSNDGDRPKNVSDTSTTGPTTQTTDPTTQTTDPTTQTTDPATQYMDRGALAVGHTVLTHSRPGAEPLVVKAWYPADADGTEQITYDVSLKLEGFGGAVMPFLGDAALDASPDATHGSYPLVVFSHGFSLNPEWYHQLAEHLASHGFVVLGPEHMEGDWFVDVIQASVDRPADIRATIDLAETGVLDGVIDTENIAVVGHSYGGYTALASAGARFDYERLAERCVGVTDYFPSVYFCDVFLAGEDKLADAMGLSESPTGLWPTLRDSRVDAILPMAADAFLFGEDGLAEVTVPVMVIGGTGDTAAPWDWGTGLAYDYVGSESRSLVTLEGAEHMIQATTCDHMPWISALPEEYQSYMCEDPAWDKTEAHTLINQLSTAFLLHNLSGDVEAEASLNPALYADIDGFDLTVSGQ